jgi:hypothetical protein
MKKLFSYFAVLLISVSVLFSCGKKDEKGDVKKDDKKEEKKDEKKFTFTSGFYCKIDGKDFYLADSLSYAKKDEKSFTIYAKIDVEGGQYDDFFIYIDTPLKTGEFALSKDNKPGHAQYNTNQFKKVKTEYDAFWSDSGKLTLTKADEKEIEGTFSFTASGTVNDVDKKLNITEGKIKVKLQ